MKKTIEFCPNPSCPTNTERDRKSNLGPWTVLYKCEKAGFSTHYFTAPKKLCERWSKRVISPVPGCKRVKVDTNEVYCPMCYTPIHLDRDAIRVAVVGPRNCGKTVYLSVLNELLGKRDHMGRLLFLREKKTESFSFRTEHVGNDIRYILPRPTQAGADGGAQTAANIPYMDYHVTMGTSSKSFSEWKREAGNGRAKSSKKSGTLNGKDVEMYFYDVAGEWFMPKEKRDQAIKDIENERNRKVAHLFNADLILFMIDSRQIVSDDAGDISNLLERGELTFEDYRKAIQETIEELHTKNHKQYHIAFCFLAVDIFQHTQSAYKEIVGNYDFRMKNNRSFDACVFDETRYHECADRTWSIFGKFSDIFNHLAQQKGDRNSPMLDPARMGIFAISALGPNAKISNGDGYSAEKYIDSFDPTNSWGVVDPILWYLSKREIISKK